MAGWPGEERILSSTLRLRRESYPDKAKTYLELPAFIGFIKVIFRRSAAAPAGSEQLSSPAPCACLQ